MRFWLFLVFSTLILYSSSSDARCISDTLDVPEVTVKTTKILHSSNTLYFDSAKLSLASAQNLSKFLQENSSIQFKTYGTSGSAVMSIRGANSSHSKVIWNGMSIGSPMLNMNDVSLLSSNNSDELYVSKGGSTAINGNSALSGVINLSNKAVYNASLLSIGLNFSNINNTDYQLKFTNGNNKFSSSTSVSLIQYKNNFSYVNRTELGDPTQKQINSNWNQFALIQSFFYKNKKHQIEWHQWLQESDRELSPAIYNRTRTNYQLDKSYRTVANYKWDGNSNNKINSSLGFTREQLRYVSRINMNNQNYELFNTRSYFDQLQYHLVWNYFNANVDQETSFQYVFDGAFVEDYYQYRKRNKYSLVSNTKFSILKHINSTLSNRLELLNNRFYYASSLILSTNKFIRWGMLPYLKISKNYNLPGLNDLYWVPGGNPNLKAEKSIEQELGFTYQKSIKSVEIKSSIDVYHSLVKDWILWQPSAIENGIWTPQNLVEVKMLGLEIDQELIIRISESQKIAFKAFYANTQAINNKAVNSNDLSVGKQLIYVPSEKMGANLSYSYSKSSLFVNFHRVSHRYTTADHSEFLPAYQLIDLRVQRIIGKDANKFIASIYVDNILNTTYESIPFQAMPARVFGVNFKYQYQHTKRKEK